jgi:acyl transferase domain-containing protein
MNHGIIPPHLHFKTINPQVNIDNATLEIPTGTVSWVRRARPRRAGVSSFGFSGTNAHILVEEAPEREPSRPSERGCEIICLSANSPKALEKKARELVDSLRREP